jgi:mRNA-degrading endonuclease RelE of RelBE toxin-antitoxin system
MGIMPNSVLMPIGKKKGNIRVMLWAWWGCNSSPSDQNDNAVIYPQFLKKSEHKLKKSQRRLSKKFVKGAKPQSKNYHQKRIRLGKVHQKIQRQRIDGSRVFQIHITKPAN